MRAHLFSIVRFANVAAGASSVLPHGLAFPGRAVVPDVVLPSTDGFAITTDATTVTVVNHGVVAASIDCFCWAIHTYERDFGAASTTVLTPQPFIPGYGAGAGQYIDPDTSAAPQSVNLPANPALNDLITVTDIAGNAFLNNITVNGNGNTINGDPTAIIDENYVSATFRFNGTEWNII